MKPSKKAIFTLILLGICVVIKLYSIEAARVEAGYSTEYFPAFGALLRRIFGKLPFSIGDILYASLICLAVYSLSRLGLRLARRQSSLNPDRLKNKFYTVAISLATLYIIFNLFWGINYNRKGIAWQLGLPTLKYNTAELLEMNKLLLIKVNHSKAALLAGNIGYPSTPDLFKRVEKVYTEAATQYPILAYPHSSLKTSLWGWLGNYAGFTGYYNPFTGEAQVNTNVPKFLQPFTSCHEVAHQLGYAKEMEANFVGYLAATHSRDTLFHYSVYLDLFTYANRNLFITDSVAAKMLRNNLSAPVKEDLKEWMLFNKRHRSFLEPIVRWGYGIFLRNNEQPQGMLSYDEVTGFLIAYYKKYGRI